MDEFLEAIGDGLPGGPLPLIAASLLLIPPVRRRARPLAKFVIRTGWDVSDGMRGLVTTARRPAPPLPVPPAEALEPVSPALVAPPAALPVAAPEMAPVAASPVMVEPSSEPEATEVTTEATPVVVEPLSEPGATEVTAEATAEQARPGLIKGNVSGTGAKIYHLPGQANYERVNPEETFTTEDAARAAGYRPAQR